jgi:hypothetical protein
MAKKFAKCQWKSERLAPKVQKATPKKLFCSFFKTKFQEEKKFLEIWIICRKVCFVSLFQSRALKQFDKFVFCFGQALLIHHPFIWEFLLFLFLSRNSPKKMFHEESLPGANVIKIFVRNLRILVMS